MLTDHFSRIGVPVFVADVKGDLSGVAEAGAMSPKMADRLKATGVPAPAFAANPVALWDVFGKRGTPVRATVSDLGPLLLGRLFGLNPTQQGVLALVFKIADDNGLLLLDIKDLRAMLQYAGDNASQFTTEYGNISTASIGAIQRSLLEIEQQGGDGVLRRADARHRRSAADRHPAAAASSTFSPLTNSSDRRSSTRHFSCGCCPSSSSSCRRSAIPTNPYSCSSSTKRTCCSRTHRSR